MELFGKTLMKKFLGYKSRSLWKGFFISTFNKKNLFLNRNYVLKKKDLGLSLIVPNGKIFNKIYVLPKYLGKKLGQFVFTKKLGMHIHYKHNIKKKLSSKKKK